MIGVFWEVVLPVLLIAGLGSLVGRFRPVDIRSVSTVVFYLFTPALVFHSLSRTRLSAGEGLAILLVVLAVFGVMAVAALGWSAARGHEAPMRAATALASTSPNVGNMGLPMAALAFGPAGLDVAVVNFVVGAVLVNSAGIALASTAGGRSRRAAALVVLRYPHVYAAAAGIVVRVSGAEVPSVISVPAETLAGAAIPTMLVVLGIQLKAGIAWSGMTDVLAVVALRLTVAPAVAWAAATLIGLEETARSSLTILAAMPVAVITVIVATEFEAEPPFVTRVVLASTLVSIVSLTVLIGLLR